MTRAGARFARCWVKASRADDTASDGQSIPAQGGTSRHGHFEFTAGAVPDDVTRGMERELTERDTQWRGRRSALIGGIILIALGLVFPLLPRRS